MPFKVKLKIAFAVFVGLIVANWLFDIHFFLGFAFLLAGVLYAEMLNPQWNFFGRAILNVKDKGPNAVAITFDDGPSEWTLKILETLKAENVNATFFILGINIERHAEIAKKIASEGHAIGLHGYSHTKYHLKGLDFIRNDLDQCEAAFRAAGVRYQSIIRFPHGVKNIFAVKEVKRRGLSLCGWGKGVWDSKKPGVSVIVERSKDLKAGEILLLHDGDGAKENPDRSQTAEALSQIIKDYKSRGLSFVTLGESA